MRTAGSETTGRNGLRGIVKHWWLLPTVAALAFLTSAGAFSQRSSAPPKAESVAASTRAITAPLRAAGEGGRYRLIARQGRLSVLRSRDDRGRSTGHPQQGIRNLCAVGAHVFLVETQVVRSSASRWDEGFTTMLACTSIEQSCGTNGTILVSSPDGIHFCSNGTPSNQGVNGQCDKNTTGAFRFVLGTSTGLTQCPRPVPALLV
jgi:hypothetical protein